MTELLNTIFMKFALYIIIGLPILFLFKYSFKYLEKKAGKGKKLIYSGLDNSGLEKGDISTGFTFGKIGKKLVYLDSKSEGHIAIFGPSGAGKTSALLIPSLRDWKGSAFSIDISGDISKNVNLPDDKKIIISPDEPEKSVLVNIFYEIDKVEDAHEKREKLEQLVNLIIDIPSNVNDAQDYFLRTARKIFLASMIAFYRIGMDFIDICKTVFFNNLEELSGLIVETEDELAIGYIKGILGENEKNLSGAKSQLNDKIKLFADNIKMQEIMRRPIGDFNGNVEPCFTPEMLEDKTAFLKVPDKKQEYYETFMHIIVGQVLDYISGREYDAKVQKRILISLDEFASLGYFPILGGFRKFRKNGANICILTQSLVDVDLVYSEKERQVILDNCKYVVVLGANDNATREYFSNMVGKEEKESVSTSSGKGGTSTSTSTHRDYAISPEDWKDLRSKLLVLHSVGYIKLDKNFYYK